MNNNTYDYTSLRNKVKQELKAAYIEAGIDGLTEGAIELMSQRISLNPKGLKIDTKDLRNYVEEQINNELNNVKIQPKLSFTKKNGINYKELTGLDNKGLVMYIKNAYDSMLEVDDDEGKEFAKQFVASISLGLQRGLHTFSEYKDSFKTMIGEFNLLLTDIARDVNANPITIKLDNGKEIAKLSNDAKEYNSIVKDVVSLSKDIQKIELYKMFQGIIPDLSDLLNTIDKLKAETEEGIFRKGLEVLSDADYDKASKRINELIDEIYNGSITGEKALQNLSEEFKFSNIIQEDIKQVYALNELLFKLEEYTEKYAKTKTGLSKQKALNFWTDENGLKSLDSDVLKILKNAKIISDANTMISDGANNFGGQIGENTTFLIRKGDIEEAYELKNALDALSESGINFAKILNIIEGENGLFLELMSTVNGDALSSIGGSIDKINPNALKATDEQVQKLIQDMKALYEAGIELDVENLSNFLFNSKDGFGFIDLDFVKDGEHQFKSAEEMISVFLETIQHHTQDVEESFNDTNITNSWKVFAKNVANAASDLPEVAKDATKEAQDSNSPSKVAEALGGDWGKGYANGILKSKKDVRDAIVDLVNTGQLSTSDIIDDFKNIYSDSKYSGLQDTLEKEFYLSNNNTWSDNLSALNSYIDGWNSVGSSIEDVIDSDEKLIDTQKEIVKRSNENGLSSDGVTTIDQQATQSTKSIQELEEELQKLAFTYKSSFHDDAKYDFEFEKNYEIANKLESILNEIFSINPDYSIEEFISRTQTAFEKATTSASDFENILKEVRKGTNKWSYNKLLNNPEGFSKELDSIADEYYAMKNSDNYNEKDLLNIEARFTSMLSAQHKLFNENSDYCRGIFDQIQGNIKSTTSDLQDQFWEAMANGSNMSSRFDLEQIVKDRLGIKFGDVADDFEIKKLQELLSLLKDIEKIKSSISKESLISNQEQIVQQNFETAKELEDRLRNTSPENREADAKWVENQYKYIAEYINRAEEAKAKIAELKNEVYELKTVTAEDVKSTFWQSNESDISKSIPQPGEILNHIDEIEKEHAIIDQETSSIEQLVNAQEHINETLTDNDGQISLFQEQTLEIEKETNAVQELSKEIQNAIDLINKYDKEDISNATDGGLWGISKDTEKSINAIRNNNLIPAEQKQTLESSYQNILDKISKRQNELHNSKDGFDIFLQVLEEYEDTSDDIDADIRNKNKELLSKVKKHTITSQDSLYSANDIIKEFELDKSKINKEDLSKLIRQYVSKKIDFQQILEYVLNGVESGIDEQYDTVRKFVSSNKIRYSDSVKSEFGNDWNSVKGTIGIRNLSKNGGTEITKFLEELNEIAGTTFNTTTNVQDAFRQLFDYLQNKQSSLNNLDLSTYSDHLKEFIDNQVALRAVPAHNNGLAFSTKEIELLKEGKYIGDELVETEQKIAVVEQIASDSIKDNSANIQSQTNQIKTQSDILDKCISNFQQYGSSKNFSLLGQTIDHLAKSQGNANEQFDKAASYYGMYVDIATAGGANIEKAIYKDIDVSEQLINRYKELQSISNNFSSFEQMIPKPVKVQSDEDKRNILLESLNNRKKKSKSKAKVETSKETKDEQITFKDLEDENSFKSNKKTETSKEIKDEVNNFKDLEDSITKNVITAINSKNKAIEEEGKLVDKIVGEEIEKFKELAEVISSDVINSIDNKNKAIEKTKESTKLNTDKKKEDKSSSKEDVQDLSRINDLLDEYSSKVKSLSKNNYHDILPDITRIQKELNDEIGNLPNNIDLSDYNKKIGSISDSLSDKMQNIVNKINKSIDDLGAKSIFGDLQTEFENIKASFNDIDDVLDVNNIEKLYSILDALNKVDNQYKTDLSNRTANSTKLTQLYKDLTDYQSKGYKLSASQSDELNEMISIIKEAISLENLSAEDLIKIRNQFNKLKGDVAGANKNVVGFFSQANQRLSDMNAKFFAQYFSFQDILRYGRQIVDTVKDIDTALTELRKVSDATESQLNSALDKSATTAKELGASITDVVNSTADWSRLNKLGLLYGNI